jgi:cobalt-zinc-cadmium efflux system protein
MRQMHGSHSHPHGPSGHSHAGHAHKGHAHGAVAHANDERRMGLAALITGLFMFAEVAGGIAAGSLALLADAGHMLTDFASLSLAWFGFRLSRRSADWRRTYGFDRFQVLVAFANGLALFAIAAWIVYEAVERLMTTPQVSGGIMVIVAVLGLAVNVAAFFLLRGADRENLNVRGAFIQVLGDLLGSVAALAAGAVILAIRCSPFWSPPSSSGAVGRWSPIQAISCSKARQESSTPARSALT